MKSWIEIAGERLFGNLAVLQAAVNAGQHDEPDSRTEVLAVIKANAYGHGITPCAVILARAGAKWLGVTDAHEGKAVRATLTDAGIADSEQPNIFVMCGTVALPGEAALIVKHRLTPVVWSLHHIEALTFAMAQSDRTERFDVHVEVDTGMSRQGVSAGANLDAILGALRAEPRISLNGVLTHFASTETAHGEQTASQESLFEVAMGQIVASGLRPQWVHVGNSSYIDNDGCSLPWLRSVAASAGARPMVRSGLALYGYLLPIEGGGKPCVASGVRSTMTWKTRIVDLHTVPAGARIGYSGTYVAERTMKLALLPIGYADGLRRELSSTNDKAGGWVVIRGQRAAIIGRVSMSLVSVDASEIDDVSVGDEVVLLGDGVTADDHARLAGTIAYEIVCGVRAG